ncbi:hypothetical protein QN277_022611 [Acacia crassicarpa]|uniref:BHLH domain-containing protein n=1 Tax=Acacia crassicarpa TaxID=499986 RepID=A0AAE1JFB0_9FABA|nr:hypothetical protein QN277_022611 [Acacia crassicarpa]
MDKDDFLNELSLNDLIYEEEEDLLIREILQEPCYSSVSDIIKNITTADTGGATATTTTVSSLSLDDLGGSTSKHNSPSSGLASFCDKPPTSSSQSTYILSFDNSNMIPATTDDNAGYEKHEASNTRVSSLKRTPENNGSELKAHQKTRKSRSTSETLDHIMSERKRRQELSEKFIALSATIPGLKKIDKSSVLSEAINYMKRLKERVSELEEENKKTRDDSESLLLMSSINKSSCHHLNAKDKDHHRQHHHQDTISSSETMSTSDDKCFRIINEALPEVEARVLHNQVLIRIHCEKHKNVMQTILAQLNNLHLSIVNSSVLNFANYALDITIIAEVEEHKVEVKEVVKMLRLALLETSHIQ